MSIRLARRARGVIASVGLLVGGGVADAVGAAVTDDRTTGSESRMPERTAASAHAPLGLDGPLTCSTYDIPTLESPPTTPSTLLDGLPYVLVCEDPADREVLSEAFIFRTSPDCSWTSDVDAPVLPPAELGPPLTPDSVLIFENCDGHPTGNMVWSPSPERRE